MCVIMIVNNERPSDEILRLGHERNKFGAGAAWIKDGKVHWRKGMDLKEVTAFHKELPTPYVLHFRAPSNGTSVSQEACHPFPIEPDVRVDLRGSIAGQVLFHNGYWAKWKEETFNTARIGRHKIPNQCWSDTRAMAWNVQRLGNGMLEFIEQKVVLLGPDGLEIYGDGWKEEDGIVYSNLDWQPKGYYQTNLNGHHGADRGTGGGSDQTTFRREGTDSGANAGAEHSAKSENGVKGSLPPGNGEAEGTTPQRRAELEQFHWARQINNSRPAISVGPPAAVKPHNFSSIGNEATQCSICNDKKAIFFYDGVVQCWDCYDKKKNAGRRTTPPASTDIAGQVINPSAVEGGGRDSGKALQSVCNFCHTNTAVAQTAAECKWICGTCWIEKEKPRILPVVSRSRT